MEGKIPVKELMPFLEAAFAAGKTFTLPITGTSMLPLLVAGRDTVTLSPPSLPLKPGDLPLYRRNDGAFVLHRVIYVNNGAYTMFGDNQFLPEEGITDSQIIGVVTSICRDGKTFPVSDAEYVKYVSGKLKNPEKRFFRRRLRYKLHPLKVRLLGENPNEPSKDSVQLVHKTGEAAVELLRALVNDETPNLPPDLDYKALYAFCEAHRITALAGEALQRASAVPSDAAEAFTKQMFKTAARHAAQERECQDLSKAFSAEGVPHCFLKGTAISAYYEKPDLRFMLDLDVLISKEHFADAEKVMLGRGYIRGQDDGKDIEYIKKPFLIAELHHELKYDYDPGEKYFSKAFSSLKETGSGTALEMTDEDFFVYVLSHTAHHFLSAGTGLRSIVDDYYLRKKLLPVCDAQTLCEKLEICGLTEFNRTIEKLTDYWFSGGEADKLILNTAEYVLSSGIYGNRENAAINSLMRYSGTDADKGAYFLKRLFPGMEMMIKLYPILAKAPFLLPFTWVTRIFKSVFSFGRISAEAKTIATASEAQKSERDSFFKKLGL